MLYFIWIIFRFLIIYHFNWPNNQSQLWMLFLNCFILEYYFWWILQGYKYLLAKIYSCILSDKMWSFLRLLQFLALMSKCYFYTKRVLTFANSQSYLLKLFLAKTKEKTESLLKTYLACFQKQTKRFENLIGRRPLLNLLLLTCVCLSCGN